MQTDGCLCCLCMHKHRPSDIVFKKGNYTLYSKTCVKWPLSKTTNWFSRPILAYCRFKIFVLSIFEWPFYTGFTVYIFIIYCMPTYMIVFTEHVRVLRKHIYHSLLLFFLFLLCLIWKLKCLIVKMLYIPVNSFSVM